MLEDMTLRGVQRADERHIQIRDRDREAKRGESRKR